MELLFTELNTATKTFSKGILILFLTLFFFVFFVIPSKLTAGKERLWISSFAQSQLRIRDHPRRARQRGVVMQKSFVEAIREAVLRFETSIDNMTP